METWQAWIGAHGLRLNGGYHTVRFAINIARFFCRAIKSRICYSIEGFLHFISYLYFS